MGKNSRNKSKKYSVISEVTAFFLFVVLVGAYLFFHYMEKDTPFISEITPAIGNPGDLLEISGIRFGFADNPANKNKPFNCSVFIGDRRLVLSDYLLWSADRIRIKLPADIKSGHLYVETEKGKSNNMLFTNRQEIPVAASSTIMPGVPYIADVKSVDMPTIGDEIVLEGSGFGFEQGSGRVVFSNIPSEGGVAGNESREFSPGYAEYSYINWTDSEIRLMVPDGAISGNICIITDSGRSNFFYLDLKESQQGKSYVKPSGYEISYDVVMYNPGVEPDNTMALWVPVFAYCPEQRNIEFTTSITPELSDFRNTMLYRFSGEQIGSGFTVHNTAVFERYEINTDINTANVRRDYDTNSTFYKNYTKSESLIPVDVPEIDMELKKISITKNPYIMCRNIYNHICRVLSIETEIGTKVDVFGDLKRKNGDSYTYAVLFTAMARKAGIPARPVSGFVVDGEQRAKKHFWAEFYVLGVGWIPVDPAMGDSSGNISWYFGNLDSSHIAFSKGIVMLPQINPSGKPIFKEKMYALQNVYAETTGNDEYLDVEWRDINVVSWW